jgi:hypothetical protein
MQVPEDPAACWRTYGLLKRMQSNEIMQLAEEHVGCCNSCKFLKSMQDAGGSAACLMPCSFLKKMDAMMQLARSHAGSIDETHAAC